MERYTRRERFYYYNNLVAVVKGLEGHYTTVDLRNEACLTGKITFVDAFMNVDMEDVVFYDPRGREHFFKNFFVGARLIRYVHIPKSQPAVEVIQKQLQNLMIPSRTPRPENFKMRRAKKYQQETLQDLAASATTSKEKETT